VKERWSQDKGTSLIGNRLTLRPYSRPMPPMVVLNIFTSAHNGFADFDYSMSAHHTPHMVCPSQRVGPALQVYIQPNRAVAPASSRGGLVLA